MTSIMNAKLHRAALVAGLLGIGAAGLPGPALSDSSGDTGAQSAPSGEAPQAMQELQAKRREIRQVTQELRQIQRSATQANPELQADQKKYRDLVVNAMASESYDPQAEVEQIRALQSELQSGGSDLAEDERQAKTQELQQKKEQFRRKQQEAMQKEEVQVARQELDKNLKAAMKEQDPQAGDLIAQLNELQQEYRNLLQKALKKQRSGGDASQGQNQG